jgi:hypothetical protein
MEMSEQQLIALHIADGTHDRIKADPVAWAKLPLIGVAMGLEWRNCSCRSTLAREITQ